MTALLRKTLEAIGSMEAAMGACIFPALLRQSNTDRHLVGLETAMLADMKIVADAHQKLVLQLHARIQEEVDLRTSLMRQNDSLVKQLKFEVQKRDEQLCFSEELDTDKVINALNDECAVDETLAAFFSDPTEYGVTEAEIATWLKEF